MKKIILTGLAAIMFSPAYSHSKVEKTLIEIPSAEVAIFTSTDKKLQSAYEWAQKMALSYSHDGSDPVGYWYEAALPMREAFCMRDVSHQAVGAQVLGLTKHNLNMFTRFVENISESKDWCTYWEINRYNLPAPVDYVNDKEFWYNLNANFDVLQTCLKMYEWTGDETYIKDPRFTYFYEKTLNEYVHRWMLEPDKIMDRPSFMNMPENFDPNNHFHTCRGLASYVENFGTLTVGSDLLASIYAGYKAYATIAYVNGDRSAAEKAEQIAAKYRDLPDTKWWSEEDNSYYNFWTSEKKFHRGEGHVFMLWFGIIERPERLRATVDGLFSYEWNIENLSYFPALLYRLGYDKEAYRKLIRLPSMDRSDYPEVSYGVVEGVAGGVMGIQPSAIHNRIITLSRLTEAADAAELKNVPVFDGYVSVCHTGKTESRFSNNTGKKVTWRASFAGEHARIHVSGKSGKPVVTTDAFGNAVSYVDVEIANGKTVGCKVIAD